MQLDAQRGSACTKSTTVFTCVVYTKYICFFFFLDATCQYFTNSKILKESVAASVKSYQPQKENLPEER